MMRIPLSLNKQGQPVMAGDGALSFKMNKSVLVPETIPCPPSAGAAVCNATIEPIYPVGLLTERSCRLPPDTIEVYARYYDVGGFPVFTTCTGTITGYNPDNTPIVTWDVPPVIVASAANMSANNVMTDYHLGKVSMGYDIFSYANDHSGDCITSPVLTSAVTKELVSNRVDYNIATDSGLFPSMKYIEKGTTVQYNVSVPISGAPQTFHYFDFYFARCDANNGFGFPYVLDPVDPATFPFPECTRVTEVIRITPTLYVNCTPHVFPEFVFEITA